MGELSQTELEQLELAAEQARQHFLDELSGSPKAFAAWVSYQAREKEVFEARRGRRDAEVRGG